FRFRGSGTDTSGWLWCGQRTRATRSGGWTGRQGKEARMAKTDKVAAVEKLAERMRDANATVVTEYRGLSVQQLTELRRSLGQGATYTVAKNTLVKRAAADAG